jgi:acetamidase/formamidase
MTLHHFEPTHYYLTLGRHEPVLHIAPGDTVVTTTIDAGGTDARGEKVSGGPNPQTGPFYVEGSEPGDTLIVHFDRLAPNREIGYARPMLSPNVVEPEVAATLPFQEKRRDWAYWRMNLASNTASLVDPEATLGVFTLPLEPMLGCFGVAAAGGQAISTATSGTHGGNMDYRGFTNGATAYLPVFEPGALLFIGDGHAVQGDGEITGTGIEISFDVQFTVNLRKGGELGWPRGENAEYIFTVGNARPLDQAVQHATTEMLRWLQQDYGLSAREASIVLGYCVRYDLGNMYDPAYTMVCKIPKSVLPG